MAAQLSKPWPGDPEITQRFGVGPLISDAEPAGYVWADGSVTYYTVGGTRHGHVHCGIDLGLNSGTPLVAPADGVVEFAGVDTTGFGTCLKVQHSTLGIGTLYGHLQDIQVSQGAHVKAGQLVAHTNNTGNSSGPHLHFTVYRLSDRHYVDPSPFLAGPASRPPQPADRYHSVAFTVVADADGHPVNVFAGPSNQAGVTGQIAGGLKIAARGYMQGDAHWDDSANRWDDLWFLTTQGWVASARTQGYPPGYKPK